MATITNKKALENIGLSEKEARALLCLFEKGSITVSDMARTLNIPRTTVAVILDNLKRRGYADKVKVRGHFEWEAVEISAITEEASARFHNFEKEIPYLKELVKTQDLSHGFSVRSYTTRAGLIKAYNLILELHRKDRIFYIEGRASVEAKLLFSDKLLVGWQEAIKRTGIVMEALSSEKIFDHVWNTKNRQFWEAHLGKQLIVYMLSDEIMNFPCDICAFGQTVMLFIPAKDIAVIIESKELSESLQKLFHGLKTLGRKTTFDAEVHKKIEETELRGNPLN